MVRVQSACMLVAAASGTAIAGPTHKVRIETTPAHATIYFNDKDSKPVCTDTPCTVDAPVGETPVIIELDKYAPVIDLITVPKKTSDASPLKFTFKLAHAAATLTIETAFAKGASVTVDDIDQGKVPVKIDLDPGQHHVVVTMGGQKLLDKEVTLELGEERDLAVKNAPDKKQTVAVKDEPTDPTTEPPDGEGSGSARDTGAAVGHQVEPEKPHGRYFVVGAAFDFAIRSFKYTNGIGAYSPMYSQVEQGPLLGLMAEVWPMEALHTGVASGLSIFGKFGFGVAPLAVQKTDPGMAPMDTGLRTHWANVETSLRYRWGIADTAFIEPSAGYVRDVLSYDGVGDVTQVPLAVYDSIRVGGRGGLLLGALEPYVSFESRLVLSGGPGKDDVSTRLGPSSIVTGWSGGAGANVRFGPVSGRVGLSYTAYSWQFPNAPMTGDTARGASDTLFTVLAQLGYTY